jgi:gliding motility-associated-like protein
MKMKKLFIVLAITLQGFYGYTQGLDCSGASPFCTNSTYTFPASTDVPSLGQVGCLYTTPNPAWYWMQIGNSGNIDIHMSSGGDVDFICWGPFASLSAACATSLMTNPGVDCSYSTAAQEDCNITGAVAGQVYVLLITNYANIETNISFNQTGGTGSTNCGIMTPPAIGDTVCVGETAVISVSVPVAGATYTWEGPNDFFQSGPSSSISIPNATSINAGEYSLSIAYNGQTGAPVLCNLVVNPKPVLTVTTDTICIGGTATIAVSGANTYIWNTNAITASINVTPTVTTQYKVTGTTQWGCKDSITTQVIVFDNPIVTVTPAVVCTGVTAVAFSPNASFYQWSGGGPATDSITMDVTSQQIYTVTATTNGGCTGTGTLTVNPNPTVTATGDEICAGESATVTASGATTYQWSNLLGGSLLTVSPMSTINLSVIGTNDYGCKGYDTITVVVHPKPTAGFVSNPEIVTIDEGAITFYDESVGATIWNWNFGEYNLPENTSTEQSPIHIYETIGYFTVWQIVSTEFGCMDSTKRIVQVEAPFFFYVPNAFTPDSDGKNETFCPYGRGIDINGYSMEIFDRWGAFVYKTNIPLGCWDGKINGQKATQGIYIYKIFLKDLEAKRHDYVGKFILLK